MNSEGRPKLPWGQLSSCFLLAAWRISTQPSGTLWRDWILVLAGYWSYTALKSDSPAWSRVTVSVMAYFCGLYAMGQIPHILVALGVRS